MPITDGGVRSDLFQTRGVTGAPWVLISSRRALAPHQSIALAIEGFDLAENAERRLCHGRFATNPAFGWIWSISPLKGADLWQHWKNTTQ